MGDSHHPQSYWVEEEHMANTVCDPEAAAAKECLCSTRAGKRASVQTQEGTLVSPGSVLHVPLSAHLDESPFLQERPAQHAGRSTAITDKLPSTSKMQGHMPRDVPPLPFNLLTIVCGRSIIMPEEKQSPIGLVTFPGVAPVGGRTRIRTHVGLTLEPRC